MLMNELLEKECHSVEYPCAVGAVNIPKERNLYTVLRRKYSNLAKEAVSQFSFFYDGYTNCNDILRKFSDYYSNRNLTKMEFYSVMDTLYGLNNLVRTYPSEQAGPVSGSPKQHEWPEKPGFHGNLQIREGHHAVKDVPGHGKISLKRLLCRRGYGFG